VPAIGGGHVLGAFLGGRQVGAVQDHGAAERAYRTNLLRGGRRGHDHSAGRVEQRTGVRDRLGVVAGGVGDQAASPLGRGHPGQQGEAAAHLERADRLHVLMLDVDRGADRPVEHRI
jgi:hypothetical protein